MIPEDLSTNSKSRARQFISKTIETVKAKEAASLQDLKQVMTTFTQYSEAANDYVESRIRYLDLLDKYHSASTEPVFQAFPGITSHLPTYPTEEMAADTEAMKSLAVLITELARQLEQLEDQLKAALKRLQSGVWNMAENVNKAEAYCDQLLVAIDSPYDAGLLATKASNS